MIDYKNQAKSGYREASFFEMTPIYLRMVRFSTGLLVFYVKHELPSIL